MLGDRVEPAAQRGPTAGVPAKKRVRSRLSRRPRSPAQKRLIGTLTVLVFLAIWQAIVQSGMVNPLFLSSPSLIVEKFLQVLHEGTLGHDLTVSGEEFIIGYIAGVVSGVVLGVAVGWYRFVSATLQPFISGFYATPSIALIPLLIIWLGIGIWSKVAVVFLGTIFLVLINTEAGVRSADPALIKAARSFGANDSQVFRTVIVPGSVPFLLAGLRLGVGRALIGVVVGELYAATAGVGYELAVAGETFQTSLAFVYIIILVLAGIFFAWLLQLLENKFQSWRPQRVGG